MKRIVSMHAYDCLSTVVASALVREYDGYEGDEKGYITYEAHVQFPSRGRELPEEWLADVLRELLS